MCSHHGHPARPGPRSGDVAVNDVHSKLNPTVAARIERVRHDDDVRRAVRAAARAGEAVCVAGGRHAMGGQQFAAGACLLDTRGFDGVLDLDTQRGLVRVQSGTQWPGLIAELHRRQVRDPHPWGIVQKQTGADRLSLGGAIAANIHGRGLALRPFVQDLEGFELVMANGETRFCSRTENPDLFAAAVGGYGLFGVVTTLTLRLQRRHVLERQVDIVECDDLMTRFDTSIAEGFTYGDFQFAIDDRSDDFLRRGIFSRYRPVCDGPGGTEPGHALGAADWQRLLALAHTDKTAAFQHYAEHYLRTSGQRYCSDAHQLSLYLDDYHAELDHRLGAQVPGSEVISEVYVPWTRFAGFMQRAAAVLRARAADVIYGTVRRIEADRESLLAWAREDFACIIFNLHVDHTELGVRKAACDFRALFDVAIDLGGSFFLTYHRWARRDQVLAAHPRLPEALRAKLRHDPEERFQSEWYRHYRRMFAGCPGLEEEGGVRPPRGRPQPVSMGRSGSRAHSLIEAS